MRAVVVSATGGPETLVLREVQDPVPGAGEVLIRVRYSGINYAETLARRGTFPVPPTPFVTGLEVVGEVAALGEGVIGFTVGNSVAAFTQHGYSEFVVVQAIFAVSLDTPEGPVAPAQAIGVPCTGVTAHQILTVVGRIRTGDTVFVQGAAGGVGSMLGEQAKALGAGQVIGLVGTLAKAEFARSHGFDSVVLRESFAAELKSVCKDEGVDLFLEGVSGANLAGLPEFLAPLGRAVFFGDAEFSTDTAIQIDTLREGSWTISGYSLGRLSAAAPHHWRPSAAAVMAMIAGGRIRLPEVNLLPPSEASRAHQLIETRQSRGKLGLDWSLL